MRGIVLSLVAIIVLAGLPLLQPQKAQASPGAPIYELIDGTEISLSRKSQGEVTAFARLKISESGNIFTRSETFANIDLLVSYSLEKSGQMDLWKPISATFSNLNDDKSYGHTDSKIIAPNIVDFRDKNGRVDYVDYSQLPKDKSGLAPCLQVQSSDGSAVYVNNASGGCQADQFDSFNNSTPLQSLAQFIQSNPNDVHFVSNYNLSTKGNAGAYDKNTLSAWFSSVTTLDIKIDEQGASTPAPYIDIPADANASNRPKLKFTLSNVEIEGNGVTNTRKWLFFQGATIDASGASTKVDGLYITVSDALGENSFVYAPSVDIQGIVASGIAEDTTQYVINPPGHFTIPSAEIVAVFGYIMDVPKDTSQNCGSGAYTTGPSGTDGLNGDKIATDHPGVDTGFNNYNSNCLDQSSTGWISAWGLSATDVTGLKGLDDCNFAKLILQGVGEAFNGMVKCLFTSIFVPIISWAAGLVQDAAGVSWAVPRRYAYASECRWL